MVLRTILIALGAFLGQAVSGKACTSTSLALLFQLITTFTSYLVSWHVGFQHVISTTFSVDNCLLIPKNTTFLQRLFQNQLAYPPNEGDILSLPRGRPQPLKSLIIKVQHRTLPLQRRRHTRLPVSIIYTRVPWLQSGDCVQ
jgi:hypothetical protein